MRKGISPLIAAVLLIALVVAVGGLTSGFFSGLMKTHTTQIGQESEEKIKCIDSGLDFDTDNIHGLDGNNLTSNMLNISVTNTGSTPLYNFTVNYVIEGRGYSGKVIKNQHTEDDPLGAGLRTVLVTEVQTDKDLSGETLEKVRVSTRVCPNRDATCNLINDECE